MQNLCITPNNKFAVSYTNNNQVVLCSIMTGEATRLDKPIDTSGQLVHTGGPACLSCDSATCIC